MSFLQYKRFRRAPKLITDIKASGKDRYRTCTLIIDFNRHPPASIIVGGVHYRTSDFNREPTRCTKCQKFGHVKNQCKQQTPTCTFCAGAHSSDKCHQDRQNGKTIKLKCSNCNGEHTASHKKCPKYQAAKHSFNHNVKSTLHASKAQQATPPTTSNQKLGSRPAAWRTEAVGTSGQVPALKDLVFPEPTASRTPAADWIHFNIKDMPSHEFTGKMGITLRLLFAIKQSHPEAQRAVDNLALTIGGGPFRDIIR